MSKGSVGPKLTFEVIDMKYLLLLFVTVSVLFSAQLRAESCATGMGTVCMDGLQRGNSVTLTATNRESYEVTITVNATLKNMRSSVPLPYTRTLPGNFNGPIATLTANPTGAWTWSYRFNWSPGSLNARHDPATIYDLPYKGTQHVNQGFHGSFSHTGDFEYAVDFGMPVGTPVYAAREGLVVGTRSNMPEGGPDRKYQNSANFVLIRHPDGTIGSYDHFKTGGVTVAVGTQVTRGQLIGYAGITGFTGGPHLHFVVFRAKDGMSRESFPLKFATVTGTVSPVEGADYSSVGTSSQTNFPPNPVDTPTESSNVTGALKVCGSFANNTPADCRLDFRTSEKIYFYVPIQKKGVYTLKASFNKPFEKYIPVEVEVKSEPTWSFSYFWITPSAERNPSGTWEATIYVNGRVENSVRFTAR
ncbi:MAG: M23 family metallopeptidase [Spirochaetia bacterium]|nr:M23 family metallopeptidase [Spirochaetia bacterium]